MAYADSTPTRRRRFADFGEERRSIALRMLSAQSFRDADISWDDRYTYTLGLLVCDDAGAVARQDLFDAALDPSVEQYARGLLKRAGY